MGDRDAHGFYQAYIEALNTRQLNRMADFVHDEVLRNGKPSTRADVVADLALHVEAVPDFAWRVVDLVVDGDRMAARLIDTGTPAKRWLGLEPTGASVEYMELALYRIRDGRFSEMSFAMDVLDIQRQLAALR